MKKLSRTLAILIATTAFIGCEKGIQEPAPYTDPSTLVSVSQFGWLQFNSSAHARSIIDHLIEEDSLYEANNDTWIGAVDTTLTQAQIDSIFQYNNYQPDYVYLSFENSQSGFVSLRQQYDFLEDVYLSSQTISSTLDNMPDHALDYRGLNSIVNSNGEYQIGDFVYFTLPDGFTFFVHEDSINSGNISTLRSISLSDFTSSSITDSIYSPTELAGFNDDYTGGDMVYIVVPVWAAIPVYVGCNYWNILFPPSSGSTDCRFFDRQKDWIVVSSQEKLYYKTFFGPSGFGHFSTADLTHYDFINGKLKKTRAHIGVKTICPFLEKDEDCENGFINYRNIPNNCSNMYDPSCNRNSLSKHEGHTSYLWHMSNTVKIKNNTRYTNFYLDNSVLLQVYNQW